MNEWDVVFDRGTEPTGLPVLAVAGEVDLAVAERFAAELSAVIAEAQHAAVVDLSGVAFIDSSGVRELLLANRRTVEAGGMLVLRAPSPACRRVLEISGVMGEFVLDDGVGRD